MDNSSHEGVDFFPLKSSKVAYCFLHFFLTLYMFPQIDENLMKKPQESILDCPSGIRSNCKCLHTIMGDSESVLASSLVSHNRVHAGVP